MHKKSCLKICIVLLNVVYLIYKLKQTIKNRNMAKKTKITETRLVNNYTGPKPIKSGSSIETIVREIAPGMIFERKDHSKFIVTAMGETSFIYQELDFFGKPITSETPRQFGIMYFAKLMRAKYFEPTMVARRESYSEIAKDLKLYCRFK